MFKTSTKIDLSNISTGIINLISIYIYSLKSILTASHPSMTLFVVGGFLCSQNR